MTFTESLKQGLEDSFLWANNEDHWDHLLVDKPDIEFYKKWYTYCIFNLDSNKLAVACAAQRIRLLDLKAEEKCMLWAPYKFHLENWRVQEHSDYGAWFDCALPTALFLGQHLAWDWFLNLPGNEEDWFGFLLEAKKEWLPEWLRSEMIFYITQKLFDQDKYDGVLLPCARLVPTLKAETFITYIVKAFLRGQGTEAAEAVRTYKILRKQYGAALMDQVLLEYFEENKRGDQYVRFINLCEKVPF